MDFFCNYCGTDMGVADFDTINDQTFHFTVKCQNCVLKDVDLKMEAEHLVEMISAKKRERMIARRLWRSLYPAKK